MDIAAVLAQGAAEPTRTVWSELALLVNLAGLAGVCAAVWLLARAVSRLDTLEAKLVESKSSVDGDIAELRATVTTLAQITTGHETHRQVTEERMKDVHRRLNRLESGKREIEETPR